MASGVTKLDISSRNTGTLRDRRSTTVYGSGVSIALTGARITFCKATRWYRSNEALTSAEVISWPLWNLMPRRSVKV